MTCLQCGAALAPNLLACPSCHALVHGEELKTLAANAEAETARGDFSKALTHWRHALELLPPNAAQHEAIRAKINELVRRLDAAPAVHASKPKWASAGGALGVIGMLLFKFKFALIFLLTKAKLLFLGLTKASTFFSMLLSFGLYWTIWGWPFALGFVLSIYVHEMGHIYQLTRYGIRATAPMFIPGLGARIRQLQYPASPHEDARVGLAGPLWGTAAVLVTYAIHLATNMEIFAAIAHVAAWVNLFNLLPVWQLDGNHAFKALSRYERAGITALFAGMWFTVGDGLLVILALVSGFRTFQKDAAAKTDLPVFAEMAILIVILSLMTKIAVDIPR